MANAAHLRLIASGVYAWNAWRVNGRPGERIDLVGADLSGAALAHANLSAVDLSAANLADADLRRANLSDAILRETNFANADLVGARLAGAQLHGAKLAFVSRLDYGQIKYALGDGATTLPARLKRPRRWRFDEAVLAAYQELCAATDRHLHLGRRDISAGILAGLEGVRAALGDEFETLDAVSAGDEARRLALELGRQEGRAAQSPSLLQALAQLAGDVLAFVDHFPEWREREGERAPSGGRANTPGASVADAPPAPPAPPAPSPAPVTAAWPEGGRLARGESSHDSPADQAARDGVYGLARGELEELSAAAGLGNHPTLRARAAKLAALFAGDIAAFDPVLAGARAAMLRDAALSAREELTPATLGEIEAVCGMIAMFVAQYPAWRAFRDHVSRDEPPTPEALEAAREALAAIAAAPEEVVDPALPEALAEFAPPPGDRALRAGELARHAGLAGDGSQHVAFLASLNETLAVVARRALAEASAGGEAMAAAARFAQQAGVWASETCVAFAKHAGHNAINMAIGLALLAILSPALRKLAQAAPKRFGWLGNVRPWLARLLSGGD